MKRIVVIAIAALMGFSAYAAGTSVTETSVSSQVFKKSKAEIKEVVFHAHLHCNSCVKKVQENIAFEKGVKGLEVSLEKQTVAVKYDAAKTSVETLKAAIQKLNVPVKSVEYPKGK
jgi:copper chaperone CopZ